MAGFTEGRLNGRGWNVLDENHKLCLIQGIAIGIDILEFNFANDEELSQKVQAVFYVTKDIFTPKLTNMDIISRMDKFYYDEFNLNIPIVYGYRLICAEFYATIADNEVEYDREMYLEKLRMKYNK